MTDAAQIMERNDPHKGQREIEALAAGEGSHRPARLLSPEATPTRGGHAHPGRPTAPEPLPGRDAPLLLQETPSFLPRYSNTRAAP